MGLKRVARQLLLRSGFNVPSMLVKRKERMLYTEATKLSRGAVVLDLGANIGKTAEVFADRGATVYAYEPNRDAFRLLEDRLSARPNVFLYQQAIGDRDGTARLYLHHDYASGKHLESSSMIEDKVNVDHNLYYDVQVRDVVSIVRQHPRVDLMKIDVEGGEYVILRRLLETGLIEKIDRLVVETHERKVPSLRGVHDEIVAQIDRAGLWPKISFEWR